ncbi:hypothetical protein, partial [Sulfuricurvum sp.]|uniref:hypothetical protein n=1 Tax=Sulfuricurvum sp. TaxID=2025608 RepID=UPI003BB4E4CB
MNHVPHFLKKSSLYVLMMLSLSIPLYCDEISGTFKEVNINKSIGKYEGTVNFDMEAKLKLYTLTGEPVDICHARWKPNWVQLKNQKSKIYTAKNVPAKVWNKIDIVDTDIAFPFSFANQSYNVHCNPGVFEPHNTQKFSMNTPGSTS